MKFYFLIVMMLGDLMTTALTAADPIRIACIGDSITEGTVLAHRDREAWPAVLQQQLGAGVVVGNFGRGGATACVAGDSPYSGSPQCDAALAFQADVVVIMLGTNDARSANAERHRDFAKDLGDLGRRFANLPSAPLVILCTPLPAYRAELSVAPQVIAQELAPAVRAVAALEGWPLIDVFTILADLGPACADGIHPDAAGTARIATAIATACTTQKIRFHAHAPSRLAMDLAAGKSHHLVTYGTSLTAGGAWPEQLRLIIDQRYPGKLTVTNSGAGGQWSQWALEHLDERVISKHPDTVLIEFGINDAFTTYDTPVAKAQKNLETMLERIHRSLPTCEIVLMTMNQPVREHADHRPHFLDYMAMYRQVAHARKLILIDLLPTWERYLTTAPDAWNRDVPDGIHPNADGNSRITTPGILHSLLGRVDQAPK